MGFKIKKTVNGETVWEPIKAKKYTASKITKYTGTLPITITADGSALIDYCIYGSTVQDGTPTPENPIMPSGCGEKTENIMDVYSSFGNMVVYNSKVQFNFSEEPQCITINGKSAGMYPQVQIWGKNGVLHFENGKTYTALIRTTNKPENSNIYLLIQGCDAEGNWSTIKSVNSDTGGILFSVSKDYVDFRNIFVCQNIDITYDNTKAYLMIIEGSTVPSAYIPYGYKLPMTVSDGNTVQIVPVYLGEVETTRRIKKLVLTGNDDLTWYKSNTRNYSWYLHPNTIGTIMNTPFYCSHGETVTNASDYGYGKVYCDNTVNLGIFDSSIDTHTKLNNYFAQQYANGTPVTIWYVLATEETAILNEPLMKIGDYADTLSMEQAGVSIPTFAGTTVIDYDGAPKPSQMYVKYNSWSGWSDIDNYKMVNGDWTQETT